MAKIIGNAIPNLPWQDKPAGYTDPVWRYTENPIIGRNGNKRSNSVFNSAVVPFNGEFAGVFRCDSRSISMDLFAGRSKDGIHWQIEDQSLNLVGADPEIARNQYRYDARIIPLEGKYYVTWCNSYSETKGSICMGQLTSPSTEGTSTSQCSIQMTTPMRGFAKY